MINEIAKQILEKIKVYDQIIIHRHRNPDPDAYGSQHGLAELIRGAFPNKSVKLAGFNEPTLAWLAGMDVISDEDYQNALVIVTDTANTDRIDDERYKLGDYLIKIDHHPNDDPYGDLRLVETSVSSCSELLTLFSEALGSELPMNSKAAFYLFAGIIGDTGRFLHNNTTAQTFRIASLLSTYTDTSAIAQRLNTYSQKELKVMGYVMANATVSDEGVSYVILSHDTLQQLGIDDAETAPAVGVQGQIQGVLTWGLFVEKTPGFYRCRLRSKGPIINEIAKAYGGGGHPLASGANAYSLEEVHNIINEITNAAKSY